MQLVIDMDHDLEALSHDDLVALNQEMGRYADELRDYRRQIKAAYSAKLAKETALAKLTPAERKALGIVDVEVTPEVVTVSFKAGE